MVASMENVNSRSKRERLGLVKYEIRDTRYGYKGSRVTGHSDFASIHSTWHQVGFVSETVGAGSGFNEATTYF